MRNERDGSLKTARESGPLDPALSRSTGRGSITAAFMLLTVLSFLAAGCAQQQPQTRDTLNGGYSALAAGHYDQAITAADQVLAATPTGPGTAEARYLRGRAFEERAMLNPSQLAQGLTQARTEYLAALDANPLPGNVEGNIRAGIANVAYHQDDYITALTQWSAAVDKLEKESDKVQALNRMSQAAQRLGRWDDADKYCALVQQMAPGQPVAQAAKLRQGARAFFVQVATVNSAKDAAALQKQLKMQGTTANAFTDPTNPALVVLRVGPFNGFTEARVAKTKLLGQYPNAVIVP